VRQTGIVLWTGLLSASVIGPVSAQRGGGAAGGAAAAPRDPSARPSVVIGGIKPAAPGRSDLSITDTRGGLGATWLLDANDPRVKPWVNDTVELHGTGTPAAGATGPTAPLKLTVDQLYVIARGCKPAPGAGR
jgi:hypothetical protein